MKVIAKSRPPKDEIMVGHANLLLQSYRSDFLSRFLTGNEKLFEGGYRNTGYPVSEVNNPFPHFRKRMIMRATWNLPQLVEHLHSWPVVKRLEASAHQRLVLWNYSRTLEKHWGSPRVRRVINWPISLHCISVNKAVEANAFKAEA